MNTLSILAMAMVIYLFGGYVDGAEAHRTSRAGTSYGQKVAQRLKAPEK
jgi:hypothetical protein